jgi:flagellum-specific ATP synthase
MWKPLDIAEFTQNKETATVNEPNLDAVYQAGIAAGMAMAAKEQRESLSAFSDKTIDFNQIQKRLESIQQRLASVLLPEAQGTISRAIGLRLEAQGVKAAIGYLCHILLKDRSVPAVIMGFKDDIAYLMSLEAAPAIVPGSRVISTGKAILVPVGSGLLGRVIDGLGRPLDGLGDLNDVTQVLPEALPVNPLHRNSITEQLPVGIKAIDGLLSLGRGQKMGLFASSGLGKSVLLGMMARYTAADIVVVALVGERGREVRDFIEHQLGEGNLKKTVVVATPADATPMMRVNGAFMAMRIAAAFSATGKHVLVLMDSLSRVADAQRELALSMGESMGIKGYPPSVFQSLTQLVEMAGSFKQWGGTVTALFTVLTQDDRGQDPVAMAARAILDGHIVLSRQYAEQGRYPAIDLEASVSRVMGQVVEKTHRDMARQFRRWHALYRENKDLLSMGAYTQGVNPEIDLAIKKNEDMENFLRQDQDLFFSKEETQASLLAVMEPILNQTKAAP